MSSTLVNFVTSIIYKILRILEKFLYITNPHKYQQSEKSNPNYASISRTMDLGFWGWVSGIQGRGSTSLTKPRTIPAKMEEKRDP